MVSPTSSCPRWRRSADSITRFKGLGEIDKDDFKGFIGDEIRLTPVTCADDQDVEKTIKFYMGANTPERKDYIMDTLVCDAAEF